MARAIWKSENPCIFARRINSAPAFLSLLICVTDSSRVSNSWAVRTMFINFCRNQRSIFVNSCIWSTEYPARMALLITNIRLSVGSCNALSISGITKSLFSTNPCIPWPIIRSPFWMASSNVLPIAITSPTDFILDPSSLSTPWNFPKSQRGILHTI